MPRHKKRVFFNPETKQVISTTQNQINSDLYTEINVPIRHAEIKSISTTHTAPKYGRIDSIPTLKSSQVPSPTVKASQFGPPTETKSTSMLPVKPSGFGPQQKQVNFEHPHINQKSIIPRTNKTSHFRPRHKGRVNSDPYTEIKSSTTTGTT